MSKPTTKNGRTFDVPAPRSHDQQRTVLHDLRYISTQFEMCDEGNYIEYSDYEDLCEALEILRQVRERSRKRKDKDDGEYAEEMKNHEIDIYLKEHGLPPRTS